jgi:hypothetical protein
VVTLRLDGSVGFVGGTTEISDGWEGMVFLVLGMVV